MNLHELRTVPDLLRWSVDRFRSERALGGTTYGDLAALVSHRSRELRASAPVGTPVLLDLPAGPEWVVEFFAIMDAGLVAVPIAPGMDCSRVERAVAVAPVPAGTAVLVCTCASERRPVVVRLTHANLLADLVALRAVRSVSPGDTLLSVLPPAHMLELMGGLLGPISCGARIVHHRLPRPDRILERVRNERVSRMLVVPALFELIARSLVAGAPASAKALAAKLRRISDPRVVRRRARERLGDAFEAFVVGGAALDPAWIEVAEVLGFRIEVGYGLTEAGPIVSLGDAARLPAGSCGRPLPGMEVAVDATGEILVRGPNVMAGYHGDASATARVLRDGWLHTGDRGRIDARGNLFVDGRIKDAIIPATGETFWPREMEEHYDSDLFADYCVAPRRKRDGNDEAMLFVVPAIADRQALHDEYLRLRRKAPDRARVKRMCIVAGPLPRTREGEVRRRELANDPERELRNLIEDVTGQPMDAYSVEHDLVAELGIDSMAALLILTLVEERFEVRLPDDRRADFRTLRALLDEIGDQTESPRCASA
ncbi:MAG: AMP-binding protein [Planctomycetota bacterium]|jgi:long-chain acyl-CoA synthetase